MKNRQFSIAILVLSGILYYLIGYQTIRDDFWQLISLYTLLFIGFFYVASFGRNTLGTKEHIAVGLLFRVILLFSIPVLSDDFYRFIWDGRVLAYGLNPFSSIPTETIDPKFIDPGGHLLPLLNSPNYYSIYPPLLQYFFGASSLIAQENIWANVLTMKVFIFLSELGTLFLLPKLLERLKLDKRLVALYALCPLPIVELVGNVHFEAFMLFFLVAALLYLTKNKWKTSALFFGLAVGAKLLPLMFLPFFIRRLGWKKSILYGLIVAGTNAILFMPFYQAGVLQNFFQSFQLYFISFEFNGSLYRLIRWLGYLYYDFNIIKIIGPILSLIILVLILVKAAFEKNPRTATLPKAMLLAYSIYFAFATTVNPWYAVAFIPLGILSGHRWPLLWAFLIPLSYHTYRNGGVDEKWWVLVLEYAPVYACAFYEFGWLDKWKRRFALKRAQIKLERLDSFYSSTDSIIEIGCGNGALGKLLREQNHIVEPIDIAHKSIFPEIRPLLYDGHKLPYPNNAFNTSQMITMLHHTPNPEALIREAMRVSEKLIIMEDIYSHSFQKYITWFTDSIVNWEFSSHPHTNKTDKEWKQLFERLGLELTETKYHPGFLLFFSQVTYSLKKKS